MRGDLEIHCPNCGEFHIRVSKTVKECPKCSSKQIIVLHERYDIKDRFKSEKELYA